MKNLWSALIGAGLVTAMAMGPASANVVYSVSGVTSSTGGNLSGTFTTNDAITQLISANIFTPATGGLPSLDYVFGLPGANTTDHSSLSQFLRLDTASNVDELQLFFSALTSTGGTAIGNGASYNDDTLVGTQLLGGPVTLAVTHVPEPISLSLFGAGLAGAALLRRRKTAKV